MKTDIESVDGKAAMTGHDGHQERPASLDESTSERETKDDNVVGWDGLSDPLNPMNWPAWKRIIQVVLASSFLLTA